jgi:hypothetical protein
LLRLSRVLRITEAMSVLSLGVADLLPPAFIRSVGV